MFGSKNPTRENFILNRSFNYQNITIYKLQVYLGEKERKATSAIRSTVIHDAENLGLIPILELTSDKESTMDQKLANCNKMYDIATYNRRQVCVTIKKYNVNKTPYIQIRLFTAKENEAMKQVAYVNYIWKNSKNCPKIWETLSLLIIVSLSIALFCFACLVIENFLVQNYFFSLKSKFWAIISEEKSDKTDNLIKFDIKTLTYFQLIFQLLHKKLQRNIFNI